MHATRLNIWKLFWCAALLGLVMASSSHGQPAVPEQPVPASDAATPAQVAQRFARFIPLTGDGSMPSTVFGVEMTEALPSRGLDSVARLGPAWVRRNALLWAQVEPIEGRGYKWTAPSILALEAELIAASERGLQPILVVHGYPRWAAQTDCAPINPGKIANWAAFLAASVKRYSAPPYNVKYWELGNEPDAPVGADSVYGCWGVATDPYFGGRRYGEMLKAVYPAIKAANQQVQVMNGSLLMERPGVPMLKFLEGMLVAGAGGSFDILGFHSYCMDLPNDSNGHDGFYNSCANDWKIDFLRQVTRRYGIANKPMFRTETGLMCSTPATPVCRQHQADFVARYYARTARDGLLGSIWYLLDNDRFGNTALLEPSNPSVPRPAFIAMQHAATMYGGAKYVAALAGQPVGVEGYSFARPGQSISIAWSNTPQTARIPVAVNASVSCTSRDGQPVACTNLGGIVTLQLGPSPSYIVAR